MRDDRFPSGRFAAPTLELQKALNAGGYGPVQEDGWFGPATEAALMRYHADLVKQPAPAIPWWQTKRARGLFLAGLGVLSTSVPALGAILATVDVGMIADAIWSGMDTADQIAVGAGSAATLLGAATSIIGAYRAKGPIDTGLIARVHGHDVRVGTAPKAKADFWTTGSGALGPQ